MNSFCQTCRKLLYRTDPCRGDGVECGRTDGGSKKSMAARKDVPKTLSGAVRGLKSTKAGTQAPPIDIPHANLHPNEYAWQNVETGELTPATQAVPFLPITRLVQLGRPRDTGPSQGKSKRAAQMREYQRKRRANKKAKEAEMAEYDKALSKAKHDGTEAEFRAANMAAYDSIKAKEMK